VSNHGGGPTIANIEAIKTLRADYPKAELRFSTLGAFFNEVKDLQTKTLTAYLEKVNGGCYSVDHPYKKQIRRAEQVILRAEQLLSMAAFAGDGFSSRFAALEPLWRRLLFCQFHDTMGGTCIREARDNALSDVAGVTAQAEEISQIAVQRLAGHLDTRGEGMPILLVNDSPHPWRGLIDTELNWFCNDPLTLREEDGREISYQRDKQACTMMWYRLGGRRRVLFPCDLPPFGVRVVRAFASAPSFDPFPSHEGGELRLENEHILAKWNEDGDLCSLTDKATGYQAFSGSMAFCLWADERDSWGHGTPERAYALLPETARTEEAAVTERGRLRQILRVRKRLSVCRLEILYILDSGEKHLRVSVRVQWDGPWKQLKLHLPLNCGAENTVSESPYGTMSRSDAGEEYFMHRFVDAHDGEGRGLTVANDGIYGFSISERELRLSLLHSAIFAQGTCVGWQNDFNTYEYTDLGEHGFTFLLSPHGAPRTAWEMASIADRLSSPPVCLMDTFHPGALPADIPHSFLRIGAENVRLGALKKWEDGDGLILRLYETEGKNTKTDLQLEGQTFDVFLGAHEIRTLLYKAGTIAPVNMLEMETHAGK
jgi:alpha-mannosidase